MLLMETSGNPVTSDIGPQFSDFLNFQSVSGLQFLRYTCCVFIYVRTY